MTNGTSSLAQLNNSGKTSHSNIVQEDCCRIVVIDDDHLNLFMTKMLVSKHASADVELEMFSDSESGLQHLKNLKTTAPIRIFLDIHMPYYDGWDVLETLTAIFPEEADVQVILQSAAVSPQDRLRASSYKMVKDVICKPLTAYGIQKLLEEVN